MRISTTNEHPAFPDSHIWSSDPKNLYGSIDPGSNLPSAETPRHTLPVAFRNNSLGIQLHITSALLLPMNTLFMGGTSIALKAGLLKDLGDVESAVSTLPNICRAGEHNDREEN